MRCILLTAGIVVASASCATNALRIAPSFVVAAESSDIDLTLLLIGDAGEAEPGDPVLMEAAAQAARDPQNTVVVFLGDNAYPAGLPVPNDPSREEAEDRLQALLAISRESGARSVFVPGNHDWGHGGGRAEGWDRVRRQQEYVDEHGAPLATFEPKGGCPGPTVVDAGQRSRLIVLDTEWWLLDDGKPMHPNSGCSADSEDELLSALDTALAGANGRHVFVLAHHPLSTSGPHGGFFPWYDHIFPLRKLAKWLVIPLPIIGSLYPLARNLGITNQDLSGSKNRHMRSRLREAMKPHSPLVFASGHSHTLQVMEEESAQFQLVSGAGPSTGQRPTGWLSNTLYARGDNGFMRIDVLKDGRVRLALRAFRGDQLQEVYSMWLVSTPG